MDEKLIAVFVGIASGAGGYWITTFWMRPILRYRELKSSILADLIFYAQVVNAKGLNDRMQALYEERVESNRRHSAELTACILELPVWYKWWLRMRGCAPAEAARNLIGYSNTTEYDDAVKREEKIKTALGINTDVI